MAENKLAELSMDFAVEILKLCGSIKGHYSIVNQLERSATSIGAKTIVTACVGEYVSLKAVAEDVEILSLEDLILGE